MSFNLKYAAENFQPIDMSQILDLIEEKDKNGDGEISKQELKSICHAIGERLSNGELSSIMDEFDGEGDRQLSYGECAQLIVSMYNKKMMKAIQENALRMQQEAEAARELAMAQYRTQYESSEIDKDDFEELTLGEMLEVIEDADRNGDGELSRKELRGLLHKLGERNANHSVDDYLDEFDYEGDGRLSYMEAANLIVSWYNKKMRAARGVCRRVHQTEQIDSHTFWSPLHKHAVTRISSMKELQRVDKDYRGAWDYECNICGDSGDGKYPVYHCSKCDFDICKNCFGEDDHVIKSPFHRHPLLQIDNVRDLRRIDDDYEGGSYACDGCRRSGIFPVMHCSACNVDFCPTCFAKANTTYKSTEHRHRLVRFASLTELRRFDPDYIGGAYCCDVCHENGSFPMFHCCECNYDVCDRCMDETNAEKPEPSAVGGFKSPLHAHELLRIVSYKQLQKEDADYIGTGGFTCNVCTRPNSYPVYHCNDCNYDICSACYGIDLNVFQSPFHEHSLFKLLNQEQLQQVDRDYEGASVACDLCKAQDPSFPIYHCNDCNYDLCTQCYRRGCNTFVSTMHPNPLLKYVTKFELMKFVPHGSYASGGYTCDKCRDNSNTFPMYHSSSNFDLCNNCYMQTVPGYTPPAPPPAAVAPAPVIVAVAAPAPVPAPAVVGQQPAHPELVAPNVNIVNASASVAAQPAHPALNGVTGQPMHPGALAADAYSSNGGASSSGSALFDSAPKVAPEALRGKFLPSLPLQRVYKSVAPSKPSLSGPFEKRGVSNFELKPRNFVIQPDGIMRYQQLDGLRTMIFGPERGTIPLQGASFYVPYLGEFQDLSNIANAKKKEGAAPADIDKELDDKRTEQEFQADEHDVERGLQLITPGRTHFFRFPTRQERDRFIEAIMAHGVTAAQWDPVNDARSLRFAMKGLGTNERTLINVISHRNNQQLQEIRTAFERTFGRSLYKDVDEECGGNFKSALLGLLQTSAEYDAVSLHKAIAGWGTDESVLIEVLCTRYSFEMLEIRKAYERQFNQSVEKDIKGDTSGYFCKLLVALSKGARYEAEDWSQAEIDADVASIYKAGEGTWGTDEDVFVKIFTKRSYKYLEALSQAYSRAHKVTLADACKSEFSGDIKKTLVALTVDPVRMLADSVQKAVKGMGTNDERLVRVLVSCKNRGIMGQLRQVYEKEYTSLTKTIKDECSGDYKKLLCAIVDETF